MPEFGDACAPIRFRSDRRPTVLISGASSGIGAAFSDKFASEGFDVVLTARRCDRLELTAARLQRLYGIRAHAIPCDLAQGGAAAALCWHVTRRGLTIDALVNAAGFGVAGRFLHTKWEIHERMMRVMLQAPAELAYRLLPGMVERRFGRIVNVASLAALVDSGAGTTYSAAKSCLARLSTSLHREVHGAGVHVTAVCPGLVHTAFHASPEMQATVAQTSRWMWTEPEQVAREGYVAVMRGIPVVVSGLPNRLLVTVLRTVPRPLLAGLARGAERVMSLLHQRLREQRVANPVY